MAASNERLDQLVGMAAGNLSELDERLVNTAERFASNTEKAAQSFASSARLIDTNAGRLTDLSSSTLKDIAGIAARFNEHALVLQSANDLIGSAQNDLAATLDGRQQALDALASGIVSKSQDIEQVMRTFEGIISKALENAEGRTRVSTEQIRSAIAEAVDGATKRFGEATEEIRRTAGTIRNELEQTRAEVKKGVMELPEETKQSTSAMRRAVSEQINALKELADIVAKSGRAFDASERKSVRATAPASTLPPPPPLASSVMEDAPLRGSLDSIPVQEQSAPPVQQPQSHVASLVSRPQGGWVKDLLRGAERGEDTRTAPSRPAPEPTERSPLHVVESLNSLSVDIARAIDHDASVELWKRYRQGERNVFTRRLYTLKGQQTFEEIRRKYNSDSEFHAAVDRYCRDFEKLLQDVGRNDRDNIMTQTYLTSDTGKVYTMLAHASGRLK